MPRKSLRGSAEEVNSSGRSVMTVGLPQPYEGVGNALRATFAARRDNVPDDMMDLLRKLDCH